MIVVLGRWPRSGTSLLMSMLSVGGLDPIRNDDGKVGEGHPVGSFQHSGVLLDATATVLPALAAERTCVKLFPRHVIELVRAGCLPAKVILASRPYGEAAESWVAAFPDRSWRHDEAGQESDAQRALDRLAEAGVPVLEVDFHDLVDHPKVQAKRVAEFVGDLNEKAMAAIPTVKHRHFGGPTV